MVVTEGYETIFWDVMLCGLTVVYQGFGEIHGFHLWGQRVSHGSK
jgi:hypothetical protein